LAKAVDEKKNNIVAVVPKVDNKKHAVVHKDYILGSSWLSMGKYFDTKTCIAEICVVK
jgi:ornithine carbamoyltransferase